MWISWKHQDTDFSSPLSFDEKVEVFYERIWGWQLHIADLCLNGGNNHAGDTVLPSFPHSAFASLQIMLSYFEMIAKYEDGFVPANPKQGQSAKYFRAGVKSVFPGLANQNQSNVDSFLETFYEKARCGLYHIAQAEAGIVLKGGQTNAIQYDPAQKVLVIDPHQLPSVLKDHLDDYRKRLLNATNTVLQVKFRDRYDYDNPL